MLRFQKNNSLEINNETIKRKIKEIYELIDGKNILGYATINEDIDLPIYVYVKKEHRGNRLWKNII